ncbi:MFS transporter [bacterium]|nr:MFS transporter [bacterium]
MIEVNKNIVRKVFILCWLAYAGAYLCRVNISIAIPNLIQDLGWDKASIGLMGSLFFWTYAFGQLINGYIGDRIDFRIFVFTSLFLSSVINLTLGFLINKFLFTILWGINGYLLSMLWGPIIRVLGFWFPKEKYTQVGVGISTSMFLGYILYWGPLGRFIKATNWKLAFFIPGGLVLLFSLYWLIGLPDGKSDIEREDDRNSRLSIRELLSPSIIFIAITCLVQGVMKESIGLWTPTIIKEVFKESIPIFTLLIPLISLLGLFSSGWLNQRNRGKDELSVVILYSLNLLVCIVLTVFLDLTPLLTIILLGVSSALLYGANTLLLANIPLRFSRYNGASTVAGFLDFSSYIGSASASIITGLVSTKFGWNMIMLLWGLLSLVGILSTYLSQRRR